MPTSALPFLNSIASSASRTMLPQPPGTMRKRRKAAQVLRIRTNTKIIDHDTFENFARLNTRTCNTTLHRILLNATSWRAGLGGPRRASFYS